MHFHTAGRHRKPRREFDHKLERRLGAGRLALFQRYFNAKTVKLGCVSAKAPEARSPSLETVPFELAGEPLVPFELSPVI